MKYFLMILILFAAKMAMSQDSQADTVAHASFFSRMFSDTPKVTHHHIIDLELGAGALGYNYLYSVHPRIRIGARIGAWYYQSGADIPGYMKKWGLNYSLYGLGNLAVWKSVNLELGAGLISSVSRPFKSNTQFTGTKSEDVFPAVRTGANCTLFGHLFLRAGVVFYYDSIPNKWNQTATGSIGYKF